MGGRGAASGAGGSSSIAAAASKEDVQQQKLEEKPQAEVSRKETKENKLQKLKEAGGNEWEGGDNHRVYFNDLRKDHGLEIERRKSGSISYAELNGEKISNNKAGQIEETLARAKVWYDVNTGEYHSSGLSDKSSENIISNIKKRSGVD